MRLFSLIVLATVVGWCTPAVAHHKPWHQIPPGHLKKVYDPEVPVPPDVEFVCLVTTEVADDPLSRVVFTEWLPRTVAEEAANRGRSFIVYHPDLNTEEGCAGF